MVKKNGKNDNKGPAMSNPSLMTTSIMNTKLNNPTSMDTNKLVELKKLFNNLDVILAMSGANGGTYWYTEGWISFYTYPFDIDTLHYPRSPKNYWRWLTNLLLNWCPSHGGFYLASFLSRENITWRSIWQLSITRKKWRNSMMLFTGLF